MESPQGGTAIVWFRGCDGQALVGRFQSSKMRQLTVCRDIAEGYKKDHIVLSPKATYTHHTAIVNDVAYHPTHDQFFGSVSDDHTLQLVDLRMTDHTQSSQKTTAHSDAVNAIAFNPKSDYVIATGSSDKTVALWDMRNLSTKLHSLEGHTMDVTGLQWHPHEESVLASSSADRRIIFWDLSKIGEEQTPEDAEDGPPEL